MGASGVSADAEQMFRGQGCEDWWGSLRTGPRRDRKLRFGSQCFPMACVLIMICCCKAVEALGSRAWWEEVRSLAMYPQRRCWNIGSSLSLFPAWHKVCALCHMLLHDISATPAPKQHAVTTEFWYHEPKQTFPPFKVISSGILPPPRKAN